MEGHGGESRRRVTLWERMSAVDQDRGSLAGLTLDAVLSGTKRLPSMPTDSSAASQPNPAASSGAGRTLLDVIRDEPPHKGQKSWKIFRERLRLKRTGSAWTSSVHVPTSDIIQPRPTYPRGPHVRFVTPESARNNSISAARPNNDENLEIETVPVSDPPQRPLFARRTSTRIGSYQADSGGNEDEDESGTRRLGSALAEDRALSAREAAAAQEAAEAEVEDSDDEEGLGSGDSGGDGGGEGGGATTMSLMDLLGGYSMGEEDEEEDEEEEEEEEEVEEDEDGGGGGGVEHTCCVCMVRHKGAAFIPCGHTFCRLCSRELLVQRGQCPLCNGFISEILDIF